MNLTTYFVSSVFVLAVVLIMLMTSAGFASAPDVEFTLATQSINLCPCSTSVVIGKLINSENTKIETKITTNYPWAMVAPDTTVLHEMSMEHVYIYITPPCDLQPGTYDVKVRVEGKDESGSTFTAEKIIEVYVLPCHIISIESGTSIIKGCYGDTRVISVKVKNSGITRENVKLKVKGGYANVNEFEIAPGEEKNVMVSVPIRENVDMVRIIAKSTTSYAEAQKDIQVMGKSCYAQEVSVVEVPKYVCAGREAVVKIQVRNTGTAKDLFIAEADDGNITPAEFELDPGESRIVEWRFEARSPGEIVRSFRIMSKAGIASKEVRVAIKDCGGVATIIIPETREICADETAKFLVSVKNIGVEKETVRLKASAGMLASQEFTLAPEEVKITTLKVVGSDLKVGNNTVVVVAEDSREDKANVKIHVDSLEECYDFAVDAVGNNVMRISADNATMFRIKVVNRGLRKQNFTVYLKAPSWVDLTPTKFTLERGESRYLYLHIAPPYNTTMNIYPAKVIIRNSKGFEKSLITYIVVGNVSESLIQLLTSLSSPYKNAEKTTTSIKKSLKKTTTSSTARSLRRVFISLIIALVITGMLFLLSELRERWEKKEKVMENTGKGTAVEKKKEERERQKADRDMEEIRKILESI